MIKSFNKTLLLSALVAAVPVFAQNQKGYRNSQYYEEMVGTLSRQVKNMQDETAVFSAVTADLKKRVARLESENRALTQEVHALRKQIAADAEVRKAQLNNLANQLDRSSSVPKKKTEPKAVEKTVSDDQEYVEHVVQKGTTLSALAKAYKVSVRDIEKANKLNKGRIYAGQKLLIPVSKNK